MRHVVAVVLLAVLALVVPGAAVSAQTTTEPPVAPNETVPPTEPAATDFTPPVDPDQTEVGDVAPSISPVPADADGTAGGLGWVIPVVVVVLLAAALGAARMIRRGPAGGDPGGATSDPYDPEL